MVDVWIMAPSPVRRDWLVRCVSDERRIHVLGTAATFAFLRSLMSENRGDVALIELAQTSSNSIRDWLAEFVDLTPVVLLSPEPDLATFNRIRHAGAGAVLPSTATPEQVGLAVKSVAAGLTVFDPALLPQSEQDGPAEQLTPRENEVLRLIANGLSNKDIAARMNISEHTIKFHIRSILGKLGAASRTEAVSRGLRSGLIEL